MTNGIARRHDVGRIFAALRIERCPVLVVLLDGRDTAVLLSTPTGEILAWDGWYANVGDSLPTELKGAEDFDWGALSDHPGKFLEELNKPTWGLHFEELFYADYSFAQTVVDMATDASYSDHDSAATNRLMTARIVGMVPVPDRAEIAARLSESDLSSAKVDVLKHIHGLL